MPDEESTTLTPEEAGAFVAQWSQNRKVEVSELAGLLRVDENQAQSLLRQARGRVSMDKWLKGQQPRQRAIRGPIGPVIAAFLVGGALGCFVIGYLLPPATISASAERPLPVPQVSVTTSQPDEKPGASAGKTTPNPPLIRMNVPRKLPSTTKPPIGGGSHPVAAPSMTTLSPADIERLPVVDVSERIHTAIPPDLVIELVTPNARYVCLGRVAVDAKAAQRIGYDQVVRPVEAFYAYVLSRDLAYSGNGVPKVPGVGPNVNMQDSPVLARLAVTLGQAHSQTLLPWNRTQGAFLLGLEKTPKDPVFLLLVKPLLAEIKEKGSSLFVGAAYRR